MSDNSIYAREAFFAYVILCEELAENYVPFVRHPEVDHTPVFSRGENAIAKHRDLMGATDPKKAAPGTIRADFAASIDANAVHGSDAPETASFDISYFFRKMELCN